MKYISFLIPCYNSESYIDRCVRSLLTAGENAEIIIVNDGSTDRTREIAEAYAAQYPDIIRVVNQPNGGHGSAVNKGIELAGGVYFKVVDSDDWLDPKALEVLMARLEVFCRQTPETGGGPAPDLVICNYVYDHLLEGKTHTISYRQVLRSNVVCGWEDLRRFFISQYFIMHSLIYRTAVLKACGIVLPLHTYYEDNLYSYQPLPWVDRLYYIDIDLYHYFIGRSDQSVNEAVMTKNIDHQLLVTDLMTRAADLQSVRSKSVKLANYMRRYLAMMYAITMVLLMIIDTDKSIGQCDELWDRLKEQDAGLYRELRYRSISAFTRFNGKTGRRVIVSGYRLARRIYKFN